MSLLKQTAFIDASGNENLDKIGKRGVSTHYIITAVIVNDNDLDEINKEVDNIRKKYFQTGEFKSSNLSNKSHKKRLSILRDLSQLKFKTISLIVDKKSLRGRGFSEKKSFFKFLHSRLHKVLNRTNPKLSIAEDLYGDSKFMNGFKDYAFNKFTGQLQLFNKSTFEFKKSNSTLLIQVADFIAGSLMKYYGKSIKYSESSEYLEIISNSSLGIIHYPEHHEEYIKSLIENGFDIDLDISEASRRIASSYVKRNFDSEDRYILNKVKCLQYLISRFDLDPCEYIRADEILDFISDNELDPEKFRRSIIAKLRDDEVLIASSDNGYKLPATVNDCILYFNKCNRLILPVISRARMYSDEIKRITNGRVDLLNNKEFSFIKNALQPEPTLNIIRKEKYKQIQIRDSQLMI